MSQGEFAGEIQRRLALRGRTPKGAIVQPELKMGYGVWWIAYQDMMTDRPESMRKRLPAIPERDISRYARERGLDYELLKRIVWGVDQVFIEHMFKEASKPTPSE